MLSAYLLSTVSLPNPVRFHIFFPPGGCDTHTIVTTPYQPLQSRCKSIPLLFQHCLLAFGLMKQLLWSLELSMTWWVRGTLGDGKNVCEAI